MPASESKWWSEQILSGKPIILNTLEQLLEEAPDEYQILVVQGIKSLMVTPLMTATAFGDIWGLIWLRPTMTGVMKIFNGSPHWEIL